MFEASPDRELKVSRPHTRVNCPTVVELFDLPKWPETVGASNGFGAQIPHPPTTVSRCTNYTGITDWLKCIVT